MSVPPWAKAFSLHDAIDILSVDVIQAKLELHCNDYEINALDRSGRTPLQCAISRCFEAVVRLLIKKGAKLDARDAKGDTAVHYAVLGDDERSLNILEILIEKGGDLNIRGESDQTPLHLAVSRGFHVCVERLLERGANADVQDNVGRTPLHYAVMKMQKRIVKSLLDNESQTDLKDENGLTALHLAAKLNFVVGVNLLLDKGANVNAIDSLGNTPLHYSLLPGKKKRPNQKSMINLFICNNVNVNKKNEEGQSPLHFAVAGNYVHEAELLLQMGAEVDARDIVNRTPLHYASMRIHTKPKLLKMLVGNGADVNSIDDGGRTPLHWAALGNFFSRGALLVESGADVDAKDKSNNTPLHLCSSKNATELVVLLLENGCQLDPSNINGYTPLQIAVDRDLKSVSRLLIDKGAKVNIEDQYGRTPLHTAVLNMNVKIVEKLLQNGANVDCTSGDGQSALHMAAKFSFTESTLPRCKTVINLLLINGSNVVLRNIKGQTPVELALLKSFNGYDIVQLLIEWGGLNTDSSLIDDTLKGLSLTSSLTFMKIVKEYIIKLNLAGISSQAPYNIDVNICQGIDLLEHYWEELERMNNIKFGRHALSDIFLKYNDLTFLSNNSIKKVIFSSSLTLENTFPHYATILRATYLKANERLDLIPDAIKSLMIPLPGEILWSIFSYLSDKDLKNILKIGQEESAE